MILRPICLFFAMVLGAETLPFPSMNVHPASMSQMDQNLRRPFSSFYSPLRLPVQRFPRTFSGHMSSPIRQPALQSSNTLNRIREKFHGFIPSRSTALPSVFFDRYFSNVHEQAAQKVKEFGERVKATVQHYEEHHGHGMQHVKEMLDNKFRLGEVKERLKQTLLKKNTLMNKLHGIGWRGQYVGVPYHTMNDDHVIVKKPGVNFGLFYQPYIGSSILVPVPIPTQHTVIPEVTTSVDFHEESEVPATIPGYMFPITSIATFTPEVTETIEITDSIGKDKLTTPQLPSNTSNRTDTTISMVDVPSGIGNENFEGEMIDQDSTAEVVSDLFSFPSTETTSQTETNEPATSETTILINLLSEVQDETEPITSSAIDEESTTNEIGPDFSSTLTILQNRFASSAMIENETPIAAITPVFNDTLSTTDETALGTGETSFHPLETETTTLPGKISTIVGTVFTSPASDPESTSETIFTVSSTIPTMVTDAISTTVNAPFESSEIDGEVTPEIISTLPSAISTETISWSSLASETTPLMDILSGFGYDRFQGSTDEVETTSAFHSTLFSTIETETSTIVIDISTTVDSAFDNPGIEVGRSTTIPPASPSTISTETTTTSAEIWTTTPFESSLITEETTVETISTFSSQFLTETTTTPVPVETTLFDVLLRFEYEDSTDSATTSERSTEVDSTYPSGILAGTTTTVTGEFTTVDHAGYDPTIGVEKTMEIVSTLPSALSTQETTTLAEMFTTIDSDYTSVAGNGETTAEIVSPMSSTISSWPPPTLEITPLYDVSSRFGYNQYQSSTDNAEITTEVGSTFSSTSPTEATTMVTEPPAFDGAIAMLKTMELDTSTIHEEITTGVPSTFYSGISTDSTMKPVSEIDTLLEPMFWYDFTSSTIPPERTTEIDSTSFSMIPTEITTIVTEESEGDSSTIEMETTTEKVLTSTTTISTVNSAFNSSMSDGDTILEDVSTLPSTISPETISWSVSDLEIIPLVNVLSRLGYDRFPNFTDGEETSSSMSPTEETTMVIETLRTVDLVFDNSINEVEGTTEIFLTIPSTISTQTTTTSEEISATTLYDSFTVDDGTILETTSISSLSETTMTPVSEITTVLDFLPGFMDDYYTDSTSQPERSTGVDLTSPSTILPETTTMIPKRLVISASEDSTFDIDVMATDNESISIISTEATTTFEEISTTTDLPFDSLTIAEETMTQVISTFSSTVPTETTMSPEEISGATDPASNSSTDDSETTTEIVLTMPTKISTETTAVSAYEYSSMGVENFEYPIEIGTNSDKRRSRLLHTNSDLFLPRFSHNPEEELDEKTLLNLIPLIIEELRQGKINPEEEKTLGQVFGDLWPLLKEESKRKQDELMDHKLAIFLFEAGQRISHNDVPPKDIAADEIDSKSRRHSDTNSFPNFFISKYPSAHESAVSDVVSNSPKSANQFLPIDPEIGVPIRFEELPDEEYEYEDYEPDYNGKYHIQNNDDTEEFSNYNNDQGLSIRELIQVGSRDKSRGQGFPIAESDEDYV